MHAHGQDFRAEVKDDALADAILRDWKTAPLSPRRRAICEYAVKLTLEPAKMRESDVETLRAAGLDDREILAVVHITSYFNYLNRLADGLGIDLEPFMPPRP
jgi:uncharacterized peroxidase-related enzyme